MKKTAVSGIIFAAALLTSLTAIKAFEYYNARIYPRTSINGIAVGGLTVEDAIDKLNQTKPSFPEKTVVVRVDDIEVASSSTELGLAYRYEEAAYQAHESGKEGDEVGRFLNLLKHFVTSRSIAVSPSYDPVAVEEMLTGLQMEVDVIGEKPKAKLAVSGNADTITVTQGTPGRILELNDTIYSMQENIAGAAYETEAVVASTSAVLNETEIEEAGGRAAKFAGYKIDFETDTRTYTITDKMLVSLLDFPEGFDDLELMDIFKTWEERVNREPQDAIFDYDPDSLAIKKFVPHKDGLELNEGEAVSITKEVVARIESGEAETVSIYDLPVQTAKPNVSLADTNDLGIVERIGFGDSEYDHSIPNRIHNVKITTDRISYTIVPPGGEFSFNQTLGEVSSRTGYRSAYVIKNGRTELGDGGGVCQVSTTLFRAILNAGLPVTRRLPHSYRVGYYELDSKPGVDATVYSGNIDFRFSNDTGEHILIYGEADSTNLYMYYEIYGTSDGRSAEIVDHEVWGYQPAPAPQYIEDPEKPVGYREQVDWSAPGIKANFKNVVKNAGGEVIREEEYYSSYRPWSAKYIIGTKAE